MASGTCCTIDLQADFCLLLLTSQLSHLLVPACNMSDIPEIPEGSVIPNDNKRDTRLRWHAFLKKVLVKGEEIVSYPILEEDNFKDLYFVRLLLAERPYAAGFGSTIKAWEDIANQLRDLKHPVTGEFLYGSKGIKGKALKDRFLALIDFVRKQDRDAIRRTGTDDEPEPGEILNLLESMLADYDSHCLQGESKNQSVTAQRKKDRDAAEAVRQASLGNLRGIYAADDVLSDDPGGDDGSSLETPMSKKRLSYASSRGGSISSNTSQSRSPVFSGQHTEAIQELMTRSQERDLQRAESKRARLEQQKLQAERDQRRLDMEEERLRLENNRLELDRAEREQARAERMASIQLMNALAQSLLNQSRSNTNNSTNNN
jgi:hypothetical protein